MPVFLYYLCLIRLVDHTIQARTCISCRCFNSVSIPRLLKHVHDALCTLYLMAGASKCIFVMFYKIVISITWHSAMELLAAIQELPLFQMNVPNKERAQLFCSTVKP